MVNALMEAEPIEIGMGAVHLPLLATSNSTFDAQVDRLWEDEDNGKQLLRIIIRLIHSNKPSFLAVGANISDSSTFQQFVIDLTADDDDA
jgi:hypothetical protein